MTAPVLAGLSLVAALLLVALPLRFAFALFVASLVLVPDTLRFPYGPSVYLVLVRVLPLCFLAGLILRSGRGELARHAFRPTGAHLGLIVFAGIAWVLGVMAARPDIPADFSRGPWLQVLDQIVVLVAATAAIRTLGSLRAARSLGSVIAAAAAIAVYEATSRHGYAEWIFRRLPEQQEFNGGRLESRGGEVRPRVAARFSLAFAWQLTMALPVVVSVAHHARRVAQLVGVPLVLAALVATSTRSAYLGVVVALVLLAVLSGQRRIMVGIAVALVVGFAVVAGSGSLDRSFNTPEVAGSTDTRVTRAPLVLDIPSDHPLTGEGYGALQAQGLIGTDSSWLQLYAELGAIGVAALALALVLALATISPGFEGTDPRAPQRLLAAACWSGVAVAFIGAASLDLFTGPQTSLVVWLLVALGVTASEELGILDPSPLDQLARRAIVPAIGLLCGVLVFVAAPRTSSISADLQALPPAADAIATGSNQFVARTVAETACSVSEAAASSHDVAVSCFLPFGELGGAARLRLSGPSVGEVRDAGRAVLQALQQRVPSARVERVAQTSHGRPGWVTTAPVTGAAIGIALALLVPGRRRPRHTTATTPVLALRLRSPV